MLHDKLYERIRLIRWLFPLSIILVVIIYQFGPARWIQSLFGEQFHFVAEILFYGTLGPALAFLLLSFLARWMEERETSDLQAKLIAKARQDTQTSRELCDDALQTLFAASILVNSLKFSIEELPEVTSARLNEADQSLNGSIQRLRRHLQNGAGAQPGGDEARGIVSDQANQEVQLTVR